MIEAKQLSKQFDGFRAVDSVDLRIEDRSIFGLIGTNGAGKSTLLRMAAGILKADAGELLIDGQEVFENPEAKRKIFFITDDAYYFPNATAREMEDFYRGYYPAFDPAAFYQMLDAFGLERGRKLRGFSKGMRKQFFIAAGLAAGTSHLLCDETFDGLDPVMRQAAKRLFAAAMEDRGLTVVLASHNLRELEDICDHVGLLYRGGVLLARDLEAMKENISKIQIVPGARELPGAGGDPAAGGDSAAGGDPAALPEGLKISGSETRGRLRTLIVRGDPALADLYFTALEPVYYERIPLSLEEIFIAETEAAGYDISNILA